MPESTLTPAPVITATFPGAKNSEIRSIAAAGEMVFVDVVEEMMECGMVGTEMRTMVVYVLRVWINMSVCGR